MQEEKTAGQAVPELSINLKSRQGFIDLFIFLSENYFNLHMKYFNRLMRMQLPRLLENGITAQESSIELFENYRGKDKVALCELCSGEDSIAFGTINSSIWWMKLNNLVICLDSENDIDKVKPCERLSAYSEKFGKLTPIVDTEFIYKKGENWEFKVGTNADLEKVLAEMNKGLNTIMPQMNQRIQLIDFNEIIADKKIKKVYMELRQQKREIEGKESQKTMKQVADVLQKYNI